MKSNILEGLLTARSNPKAKDTYEITPTERTDKFWQIVYVRFENQRAIPFPLGREDYEQYRREVDELRRD